MKRKVESKHHPSLIIAASAVVLMLMSAAPQAWEGDVHFILTWWLASKAGFSPADAERIANDNLSMDQGFLNPATALMPHAILLGKEDAAVKTRIHHFPSTVSLPSDPKRRPVLPGGKAAWFWLNAMIDDPEAVAFDQLGAGLHALQDSWSHQGVPDTPIRPVWAIHPELSWAHPEARGGWFLHDADITYRYAADAFATAQATWDTLIKFLNAAPKYRHGKPADWKTLEPIVREFADARSKQEKLKWVAAHAKGVPKQAFVELNGLSIVGTADARRELRLIAFKALTNQLGAFKDALTAAREFLPAWFSTQNLKGVVDRFIDIKGIRDQLGGDLSDEQVIEWCLKFLAMFLARDHGLMNELGHGARSHERYGEIPREIEGRAGAAKIALRQVSLQVQAAPPLPYVPVTIPEVGEDALVRVTADNVGVSGWAMVFHLSHAPNDAIFVVFSDGGSPRIVRLFSVVSH